MPSAFNCEPVLKHAGGVRTIVVEAVIAALRYKDPG